MAIGLVSSQKNSLGHTNPDGDTDKAKITYRWTKPCIISVSFSPDHIESVHELKEDARARVSASAWPILLFFFLERCAASAFELADWFAE